MASTTLVSVVLFTISLLTSTVSVTGQRATCVLQGTTNAPTVSGLVTFQAVDSALTEVSFQIQGLTTALDAQHGIHIHEFGDLISQKDGVSAGKHFVGSGQDHHGCPPDDNRHSGDLGNVQFANGQVNTSRTLNFLPLTGRNSIIGHAVVLHSDPDDCTTQAAGNSGNRIAWCVIGIADAIAIADASSSAVPQTAVCRLQGSPTHSELFGEVWLTTAEDNVLEVTAWVEGLTDSAPRGFHIHERGDLTVADRLGGHYNPASHNHTLPGGSVGRHLGDMGNIQYYDSNTPRRVWYHERLAIQTDPKPMFLFLGRGIVLHEKRDDGCSQPTGDAGSRWAYCTIGIANPDGFADKVPKLPSNVEIKPQTGIDCNPSTPSAAAEYFWWFLLPTGAIAVGVLIFFGVRWFRARRLVAVVV